MTNRTAANRYARALLDVAVKEHQTAGVARTETDAALEDIQRQLASFHELLEEYPVLKKALLNPAVPVTRKRAAVVDLTKRLPLQPIVSKLLALLAERDRLALLPDLLGAYRERLLDYLNVVRAEVTTAVPLSADRARRVEEGLAALTGRTVTLATKVDSTIIGGVVARVGSTIYDGSVKRQLERMKEKLVEGGGF
jgi:F-type H+-transporting ATPase subunit delta